MSCFRSWVGPSFGPCLRPGLGPCLGPYFIPILRHTLGPSLGPQVEARFGVRSGWNCSLYHRSIFNIMMFEGAPI